MDAKLKKIAKKIQKLLRLAEKAGSEDEAHTAMSMAREMLTKYNLTLGDVDAFTEEECNETLFTIKSNYMPSHVKILIQAMNMLFQKKCITGRSKNRNRHTITFIGVGADSIVATQTFQFLLEFSRRKANERSITQKEKADYNYGFAYSVRERAWVIYSNLKGNEQECALVPLKEEALNLYMGKHYNNLKDSGKIRQRPPSSALLAGLKDGISASLDRQVGASDKTAIS